MKSLVYISLLLVLVSCSEEEPVQPQPQIDWSKQNSSKLNKTIAQKEEVNINLYLEMRPKWDMTQSGSGLRYWIYEEGDGDSISSGDVAEIEYTVHLLDGTEAYKTEQGMYEEIVVDESEVESGLQEALKLMQVGDKAKLIVPSHLGHGVLGDLNKISTMRTLVIDLTLLGKAK